MRYARYVDGSDVAGGHGTHVCGTLVGDATGDGASTLQLRHVPNRHYRYSLATLYSQFFTLYLTTLTLIHTASSAKAANGLLPAARLAFFDLGDSTGALYVPTNVADIYRDGRQAGAVVHSNSWG